MCQEKGPETAPEGLTSKLSLAVKGSSSPMESTASSSRSAWESGGGCQGRTEAGQGQAPPPPAVLTQSGLSLLRLQGGWGQGKEVPGGGMEGQGPGRSQPLTAEGGPGPGHRLGRTVALLGRLLASTCSQAPGAAQAPPPEGEASGARGGLPGHTAWGAGGPQIPGLGQTSLKVSPLLMTVAEAAGARGDDPGSCLAASGAGA